MFPFDAVKKIVAYYRGTDTSLTWADVAQALLDVQQWALNQLRGGAGPLVVAAGPCNVLSTEGCCDKLESLAAANQPGTVASLDPGLKSLLATLAKLLLERLLSA